MSERRHAIVATPIVVTPSSSTHAKVVTKVRAGVATTQESRQQDSQGGRRHASSRETLQSRLASAPESPHAVPSYCTRSHHPHRLLAMRPDTTQPHELLPDVTTPQSTITAFAFSHTPA